MKVIAVNRLIHDEIAELPQVEYIPDSAILTPGKPFFIPDIEGPWNLDFFVVFRISRLGKSIAQRFAHRYYDSVTIAARPVTPSYPANLITGMDGGWIMGEWIPVQPDKPLIIKIGDSEPLSLSLDNIKINPAIERLSLLMTLKMGDIIAPGRLSTTITPIPESRVQASINDKETLNFKIK